RKICQVAYGQLAAWQTLRLSGRAILAPSSSEPTESAVLAQRPSSTSLMILGDDLLVGHALESLLQSVGYQALFLAESGARCSLPLPSAHLVLLAPCASPRRRRDRLRQMRQMVVDLRVPVLELTPSGEPMAGDGTVQLP